MSELGQQQTSGATSAHVRLGVESSHDLPVSRRYSRFFFGGVQIATVPVFKSSHCPRTSILQFGLQSWYTCEQRWKIKSYKINGFGQIRSIPLGDANKFNELMYFILKLGASYGKNTP